MGNGLHRLLMTSAPLFNNNYVSIICHFYLHSVLFLQPQVMFDLARYHAPSTIFLDELDALASKRDGGHHSNEHEASRRLKTELLIQLDGLSQTEDQVFFLATSNLPW